MKKRYLAALLALCMTAALLAQEVADTSALSLADVSLLNAGNLERYSTPFLNGGGRIDSKYLRVASRDEKLAISAFGGDTTMVDTPLEIALLSTCAGVVDIHPVMAPEVAAILPANNPKLSDLKLGAAVLKEMQVLRFLGNTNAVGRHEGIIKFITDRGNVSRAEIDAYYQNGIRSLIAETVDAEFNKVEFMINRANTAGSSYNVVLTRNAQNQYVLSYEGYFNDTISTRTLPAVSSLEALSSEMSKSGDFSATAFNTVRASAALMPAVIFDGWKRTTPSMVNPYELLTKALTDFYITPNNTNYGVVLGINARALLAANTDRDEFTNNMLESIGRTLKFLNPTLFARVDRDLSREDKIIVAANIPDDPRYGIFTLNIESGDAIFVSKRRPAAGLLVSY
jgi:hypothetical protein